MFIGHFGLAYAAKRSAPRASLATLFAATAFVDILWPVFLLAGWETARIEPGASGITPLAFESYPYTHSLLMGVVWALVFGAVHWRFTRAGRESIVLGALVVSHWLLDLIVHAPDLPLIPGSATRVGFGLWHSLSGTLLVEGLLFAVGVTLYLKSTRPIDTQGRIGAWIVIGLLVLSALGNTFGPPPPSMQMIAYVALVGTAVTLVLAWWSDRHRAVIAAE